MKNIAFKTSSALMLGAFALAGCEQTMADSGAAAMSGGTMEQTCSAEVMSQSGSEGVDVVSSEPTDNGMVVKLTTPGGGNYTCVVDEDGNVAEVFPDMSGNG